MEIVIDYEPFPHQNIAHADDSRFLLINGGRRAGKSEYAVQNIIHHAISTPHGLSWYLAPTYRDAKEIGWDKFKLHIPTLMPVIKQINESELRVQWRNGHTTYFKGTDNRQSLRGRGLTHCTLDEAAFQHPDVWYTIVRPALMDRNGSATLITTPNGRNWFYDIYSTDDNFAKYSWPTEINPLITPEELDHIRSSLSERDFRQEILAEFVTASGLVYDDFDRDENVIPWSMDLLNTFSDVSLGIDFGYANPTAICFMGYDHLTETITQFDEIYVERTPIEKIIELVGAKLRSYGLRGVTIYTDPAGNAEELSSGESPVDMFRKAGYIVKNKGSRILPGVSQVRSYIRNANGKRRFMVTDNCTNSIKSLEGYTYPPATSSSSSIKEEPLKDGVHDHMTDAIRYYIVNKFDSAKYVGSGIDDQSYLPEHKGKPGMKRCLACRRTFFSTTPKNKPPFTCPACTGDE